VWGLPVLAIVSVADNRAREKHPLDVVERIGLKRCSTSLSDLEHAKAEGTLAGPYFVIGLSCSVLTLHAPNAEICVKTEIASLRLTKHYICGYTFVNWRPRDALSGHEEVAIQDGRWF
jgi:hypothetical protein